MVVPRPSKKRNTQIISGAPIFSRSICEVILETARQFHKDKALAVAFYKIKVFFFNSKIVCSRSQGQYYSLFPWTLNFIIIFMGGGIAFNKT